MVLDGRLPDQSQYEFSQTRDERQNGQTCGRARPTLGEPQSKACVFGIAKGLLNLHALGVDIYDGRSAQVSQRARGPQQPQLSLRTRVLLAVTAPGSCVWGLPGAQVTRFGCKFYSDQTADMRMIAYAVKQAQIARRGTRFGIQQLAVLPRG